MVIWLLKELHQEQIIIPMSFMQEEKQLILLGTLRAPVLITNNPGNAYNFGPLVNPMIPILDKGGEIYHH